MRKTKPALTDANVRIAFYRQFIAMPEAERKIILEMLTAHHKNVLRGQIPLIELKEKL